jgi:hypothetical protein
LNFKIHVVVLRNREPEKIPGFTKMTQWNTSATHHISPSATYCVLLGESEIAQQPVGAPARLDGR